MGWGYERGGGCVYDVIGIEEEVPVGDGRMRCINDGVAGTVMLMASRRRLYATKQ